MTGQWSELGRWWRADDGRVTAFVAVVAVALIAMIGLTVDAGLALATKVNEAAATAFLDQADAQGTVTVAGDTVSVVVTATRRTQLLDLFGIESLTVTGEGSAHPQRGVDGIDP